MPVKQASTDSLDSGTVASSEGIQLTQTNHSGENGERSESIGAGVSEATEANQLESTPAHANKQTIRVVSLERLLRPSLVGAAKEANGRATKSPYKNRNSARKSKENISIIEISDDDSEPISWGHSYPRRVSSRKLSFELLDEDREPQATAGPKNPTLSDAPKVQHDDVPSVKVFRIVVAKLPGDLNEIKGRFKLKSIYNQYNVEIESFGASSTHQLSDRRRMEDTVRNETKEMSEGEPAVVGERPASKDKKLNGTEDRSNSDSDEPLRSNKHSKNIPKVRKVTRTTRKRRPVSDSEEENSNTGKPSKAANAETNGNNDDKSDDSSSEEDVEFASRNTAAGRSQRAAERLKRTAIGAQEAKRKADKDQDQVEDKDDFQPRKKRTRIRRNSPSSSEESKTGTKSKKRRRIKKKSSDEGSDGDSPTKGRKNIRKLLKKSDLDQTTKNAEQEERERKQRIVERQKLYNQVYDEKPEEAKTLDQLVLDFDEETKEPLLEVDKKLVKQLKPHQANGIKFMFDACFESLERMKDSKGSGCILAHCMGLGKTLQIVTLTHTLLANADTTGVERVLVVCPLSTVLNWVNEFNIWMKHVKKGTEVEVYEISKYKNNVARANKLMEWHNEGGVMILGYDMFRNLANPTATRIPKKVRVSLQTSLIDPGPELDEDYKMVQAGSIALPF